MTPGQENPAGAHRWQPKWTQGGKEADSTEAIVYRVSKGEQCGQRIIGVNDEGVEVSIPHCPYVNMLDPSGNVCPVVTSPNRDIVQADQKYRYVTVTVRQRKGWVIWDYDPSVHYGVTAAQWVERREELQAQRQQAAKKSSARYNAMTNDRVSELLAVVADDHKTMARVVSLLEAGNIAAAEKVAGKAKAKEPGA